MNKIKDLTVDVVLPTFKLRSTSNRQSTATLTLCGTSSTLKVTHLDLGETLEVGHSITIIQPLVLCDVLVCGG